MKPSVITITSREHAELLPLELPASLGANQVRGKTLASLVSPGTELVWNYEGLRAPFPSQPGYASVFQAEEIGPEVKGIEPGTVLLCMGGHRSVQQQDADSVVPVPAGLPPQEAVIARLMGVSLTTLMTTKARPGDIVLVTGMGPVGYLCAHLFANSGYDVRIVEPNAARRTMAEKSGLKAVDLSLPADIQSIQGKVALVAECSGHEKAVLDGARMLRKAGELVLIGVPWKRRTDITAHEILSLVFFNYIVLRSGWEWELPHHASDFRPHSIFGGYQLALRWLAERRIPLEGLISLRDPADAQSVYQELHSGKMQGLFQVFDWEHQGRN